MVEGLREELKKEEYLGVDIDTTLEMIKDKVIDVDKCKLLAQLTNLVSILDGKVHPFKSVTKEMIESIQEGPENPPTPVDIVAGGKKFITKIPNTEEQISLRLKNPAPKTIVITVVANSSDTSAPNDYYYSGAIGKIIIPKGYSKVVDSIALPAKLKRYVLLKAYPEINIDFVAETKTVGG